MNKIYKKYILKNDTYVENSYPQCQRAFSQNHNIKP